MIGGCKLTVVGLQIEEQLHREKNTDISLHNESRKFAVRCDVAMREVAK